MRTYRFALLCLTTALLLAFPGVHGVKAEPNPEMYDTFAPIGSEAKRDLMDLVKMYEIVMTQDMHVSIAEIRKELGEDEFLLDALGALQTRQDFHGPALRKYRTWVSENGGDASKIVDFPDDWRDFELEYYWFFATMKDEGAEWFKEFHELAADGNKIELFDRQDNQRLAFAQTFAKRVDDEMEAATKVLSALLSGRNTTNAARKMLESHRDQLEKYVSGLDNRLTVLEEIETRVSDYAGGDKKASLRVPKVEALFNTAYGLVKEKCGTAHVTVMDLWRADVTPVLMKYTEAQGEWIKSVNAFMGTKTVPGLQHLRVPYPKYEKEVRDLIKRIDAAL